MDAAQVAILFQVGVKLFSIWGWMIPVVIGCALWTR